MRWQDVSKKLEGSYLFKKRNRSRTLWVGGTGSLLTILFTLALLTGVTIDTSEDITCGTECISYFNITTTYWRVCFEGNFSPIYTDRGVRTELYVPTYGRKWRLFNPEKDCIERKKVNRFKIIGYKNPEETVKWGVHLETIFKDMIDPFWYGIDATPTIQATNITLELGSQINITANLT